MRQSKTEYLEILRIFPNHKKNIIANQEEQVIFIGTNILNMKAMVIEIKFLQSKNTWMKLNHT